MPRLSRLSIRTNLLIAAVVPLSVLVLCVGAIVYVSLDIDSIDPAYAPGTGTPEVGGFTSHQMLQLVRGLSGLNLVGFDLVEVSPPYDPAEITSILAANLAFEFLSLVASARRG